jgi:hypothetical protein
MLFSSCSIVSPHLNVDLLKLGNLMQKVGRQLSSVDLSILQASEQSIFYRTL